MNRTFPDGVWPVMLTPFTEEGEVDYNALDSLVEWYIRNGVAGLFAVCQSSEMFYLDAEEKIKIAERIVKVTRKRVPVIASGHTADTIEVQAEELNQMAQTGVDALVLVTNRLAQKNESDDVWIQNLDRLLTLIDPNIPLGFYECPYPYKRVLSPKVIQYCVENERIKFLKDTCCKIAEIKEKLRLLNGSSMKLYNANTATLLESLRLGCAGYSGVMANFHCESYVWLCKNFWKEEAEDVADLLTVSAMIENCNYPKNAKYGLNEIEKIPMSTYTRAGGNLTLTEEAIRDVRSVDKLIKHFQNIFQKSACERSR